MKATLENIALIRRFEVATQAVTFGLIVYLYFFAQAGTLSYFGPLAVEMAILALCAHLMGRRSQAVYRSILLVVCLCICWVELRR